MKNVKGMSIITEVLFLAIVITLIFLVYTIATPIMQSMQVSSAFDQIRSFMLDLDGMVQEVATEGKGSKRSIDLSMGSGMITLDEENDLIKWHLKSDTPVVSQRSMQKMGNMIIGSNLDTMAYEGTYNGESAYVLENERLKVFINKTGSPESPVQYRTDELLLAVYNKGISGWMDLERLEISIDNSPDSMEGTGYTELSEEGLALSHGSVVAHINTSYVFMGNYTITFILESGADFLMIEAGE